MAPWSSPLRPRLPRSCAPAPVAPPPPPAARCRPAATKVTYAADAFFDFDKSVLKPEGKAKLDDLVGKVKGINLEVIIAVGHTDSVGADAYNQKLSVRRAEAVKAYLVSKGIEKNRVYTEGKGEKQPVADNKTAEGRAKNRRVEIEVVGTRANTALNASGKSEKSPALRGFFLMDARRNGAHSSAENRGMTETPSTPTRPNWPSFPSSPTAGGTRRASSARCTRSTRCGWTGSSRTCRWPASACWTSAAAAASWPIPWRARAPRCWASTWPPRP